MQRGHFGIIEWTLVSESVKRRSVAVRLLCVLWITFPVRASGQAQRSASSNETRSAIERLFQQYAKAISDESIVGIGLLREGDPTEFGDNLNKEWAPIFAIYSDLRLDYELTLIGTEAGKALVRQSYVLSGCPQRLNSRSSRVTVRRGLCDYLLHRSGSSWLFSGDRWAVDDLTQSILGVLDQASTDPAPRLLQFASELRGGEWLCIRVMRWSGAIPVHSSSQEPRDRDIADAIQSELQKRFANGKAGSLHLFLQWDGSHWAMVADVWLPSEPLPSPATQGNGRANAGDPDGSDEDIEAQAKQMKLKVEDHFADAGLHRDYATFLERLGLFALALDEMEKASKLDPAVVTSIQMDSARSNTARDPLRLSQAQLSRESRVGTTSNHPRNLLQALASYGPNPQDPGVYLQRSLAHLQLGSDQVAYDEWSRAAAMVQRIRSASLRQALETLSASIERRLNDTRVKPPAILVSDLFTVRSNPANPSLPALLVALERAQHVIYSDFGVPMAQTEVVLFSTQEEFQRFTPMTTTPRVSESTAAYANGDAIITYPQEGADLVSVVAHEYGHIAVQQLTNRRHVPDWLNEGVACCVQGGYWHYKERCRAAYPDRLISMDRLLDWKFQGEDAYLAYSQANWIVEFMVEKSGKGAVLNMLNDLGRGMDANAAFLKHLGVDQRQFWAIWMKDKVGSNL